MLKTLRSSAQRIRRRYAGSDHWLAKFLSPELVTWRRDSVAKGVAVGMFWAFIPIPMQMIPAAMFCLLWRTNVPVAIACVWISNPFTYLPILLLEYKIGAMFFEVGVRTPLDRLGEIGITDVVVEGGVPLLTGAVVLSSFCMIAGYAAVHLLWPRAANKMAKRRERKAAKARANAEAQ